VLNLLKGDEAILDLGCGNAELARNLARRGQRGSYFGVDFSLPLLREAEAIPAGTSQPQGFSARFMQVDLTNLTTVSDQLSLEGGWSVITAFAVLHHIPSMELRLNILRIVHQLLKADGIFIHSNWQFLNSEKLKARIQPWEAAATSSSAVDAGDYLLDWRSGGKGLRYIHHFNEEELGELAQASGFCIIDTFYSDGEGGKLGLYQVWKPVS
jgi:tRNA (uracil-5-)-methyltransferase TRM9